MASDRERLEMLENTMSELKESLQRVIEQQESSSRKSKKDKMKRKGSSTSETSSTKRKSSQLPIRFEFPKFNGEEHQVWLERAKQYFAVNSIHGSKKVYIAALYLDGEANQWWRWFAQVNRKRKISWRMFETGLLLRFGTTAYEDADMETKQHRQDIQSVSDEYEDIMAETTKLPPPQEFDHQIYLKDEMINTMLNEYEDAHMGTKHQQNIQKVLDEYEDIMEDNTTEMTAMENQERVEDATWELVSVLRRKFGEATNVQPVLATCDAGGQPRLVPAAVLSYHWTASVNVHKLLEALVQWDHLPCEDATWESASLLQRQFPDLHLEDKDALQGKGNDGILVYHRHKRKALELIKD